MPGEIILSYAEFTEKLRIQTKTLDVLIQNFGILCSKLKCFLSQFVLAIFFLRMFRTFH
jgi:hypothetical protein